MSDILIGASYSLSKPLTAGAKPAEKGEKSEKSDKRETKGAARSQAKERSSRFDTVELSDRVQSRRPVRGGRYSGDGPEEDGAFAALFDGTAEAMDRLIRASCTGALQPLHEAIAVPEEPVREPEESEEAWRLRRLDREVTASWTENFKTWLKTAGGLSGGDGQRYLNEQSENWAAQLRERQPAQFRMWLEKSRPFLAAGMAEHCVLPPDFTEEDRRQWMAQDLLRDW